MMEQIVKSFFSKATEKLVDYGFDAVGEIVNFESTLKNLEKNLKSLSDKAYDVEKEIRNAELSGKKKRKREVENWLEEVKKVESEFCTLGNEVQREGFIKKFLCGDEATKLNERVCELVEQSRHFGELLLDDDITRGEAFLVIGLVGDAFDENVKRIWKFLVIDKVSSIGIYGMGGVGKSTLAKHINNQLLERNEECVLWVTVSRECSITMLQDKIARLLSLDLSDEDDEDKRAARLNRALSLRKNIVLILDDIWKNFNLEKVGDPLSVEGCRLMITTRSKDVCRQIGCQQVIAVEPLRAGEGWQLFREKLGQETTLTPQVEEIAMSVAKMCDGLPLGIITLAGSMRGETHIHVWRNTETELQKSVMGLDEMEDQVYKVLKYSFDRLDPNHQRREKRNGYTAVQLCFLYCSLYPEDYRIPSTELVRKFISEELVDKRKGLGAQIDEGYSILSRLVNVSLLERIGAPDKLVQMHDLVRATALTITGDKNMVKAGLQQSLEKIPDEEEWRMDLEKASLMCNSIEEIPPGISPNCPKLSTLFLQKNPLKLIPESFFSRMCSLCILDLSQTRIKELPISVSGLESLRALLLGGCVELEYVPDLGKLKALRELDLTGTAIREVPEGMDQLANLKYLFMCEAKHLQMLATSLLLNFPCLQLLHLPYQIQAELEEIQRLTELQKFVGRLKYMSDFNRFIESRQSKRHSVPYSIMVGELLYCYPDSVYGRKKRLIVNKYDFNSGEERRVVMLADDIQRLEFKRCEGLSSCLFDDLSNPRSLERLGIFDSKGIECILTHEQFMAPEELKSRFHALKTIELRGLPDFMGVIDKQETGAAVVASPPPPPPPPSAVFSSLTKLYISACNKMKTVGLPISVLQNLGFISIESCEEIEEIIEVAADDDTRGEGEAPAISFPKLSLLRLRQLPRLRSICNVTMICGSLKTIHLGGCPALKKVPLYFPPPTATPPYNNSPRPALRSIHLREGEREWWDSLEWDHPLPRPDRHPPIIQFW